MGLGTLDRSCLSGFRLQHAKQQWKPSSSLLEYKIANILLNLLQLLVQLSCVMKEIPTDPSLSNPGVPSCFPLGFVRPAVAVFVENKTL